MSKQNISEAMLFKNHFLTQVFRKFQIHQSLLNKEMNIQIFHNKFQFLNLEN